VDTSKSVFQLHGVDAEERVVLRRQLRRSQVLPFFSQLAPVAVGLEACAGSHHLARELAALGHAPKLLAPQHVKAYLKRGKNDARDAEAGCEAMSRPTMSGVPVKTTEQQAGLMLVGVRDRRVRERTRLGNEIRGYAAEFGLIAPKGLDKIEPLLARIAAAEAAVPPLARELFADLGRRYVRLQGEIAALDRRLAAWSRAEPMSHRLAGVPSLGPVGSALLVLKTPDPAAFRSGRDFAAWLGLTPKDHSTAGKTRLGGITKQGDKMLRRVLVSGAMALLQHVRRGAKPPWPWIVPLLDKSPKVAAVAIANRVARIAWRMMLDQRPYRPAAPAA
jgi:transposase